MKVDWLIVGAGFAGSVLAERIASQLQQKVLLVDKRHHIAGNAYDEFDEYGLLVHRYGPHIFHTNARAVWEYLQQFTQWRSYYHQVLGVVEGQQIPIPFNINSLYALFPHYYAERLTQKLVETYGFNVKVPILNILENTQDADLRFLADYVYRNVFEQYTLKQWQLKPKDLAPSVTARVPIYVSRDNRYFQDTYQGMPQAGYTALFQRMLSNPLIKILLNTDYREIETDIQFKRMIFTGEIDSYFSHVHGKLPYRSLNFKFIHTQQKYFQSVGTVNYPNEYLYTRTTEFKYLTGQHAHGSTYIEEYPQPYVINENIPYYPIPKEEYRAIYRKYLAEAEQIKHQVLFVGRLAEYQYYNMDQVVAHALTIFNKEICSV